jgi:hypothetical protein
MQSRFRLPRSPDQVIALDTRRSALRFLAELPGLLSQALIYCNRLLEMSSLRHALLHLERGWERNRRSHHRPKVAPTTTKVCTCKMRCRVISGGLRRQSMTHREVAAQFASAAALA